MSNHYELGIAVGIDHIPELKDILPEGIHYIEPMVWGRSPSENDINSLEPYSEYVKSFHIKNYRNEDDLIKDIRLLGKRLPELKRVVIHPFKREMERDFMNFIDMVCIAANQENMEIGIENVRKTVVSKVDDVKRIKAKFDSYKLDNVGFVIDSSHIPITHNREINTDTLRDYCKAAGSRLFETHISEPYMNDGKFRRHGTLVGELYNWERLIELLGKSPIILEIVPESQAKNSVEYIRRLRPSDES